MTRSDRGSATIHTLLAAVLLLTAVAVAILWCSISTARHRLAAAADLTALSAAQSLATTQAAVSTPANSTKDPTKDSAPTIASAPSVKPTQRPGSEPRNDISLSTQQLPDPRAPSDGQPPAIPTPAAPCEIAAQTAILNKVRLTNCDLTTNAVTVQVSLELDLPMAHPTLTAAARAGPI